MKRGGRYVWVTTGVLLAAGVALCYAYPMVVRLIAGYGTPITFHGRVIDQYGAPVPGAETTWAVMRDDGENTDVHTMSTGQDGMFEIRGLREVDICVEVKKPGYYRVHPSAGTPSSRMTTQYYDQETDKVVHRDKAAPVTLLLYKAGEPEALERISPKNAKTQNGETVTVFAGLSPLGKPNHTFYVTAWSDRREKNDYYEWGFTICPAEGEIQPRAGYRDLVAPEEGYHAAETFVTSAAMPRNKRTYSVTRDFFVRFKDGTFARIKVRVNAPSNYSGGVVISGYLNPEPGSRNLETDPGDNNYME